LTASTKIIDVTGETPVEMKGFVPARSVVIPGSYTKKFPAGDFQVPCAIIIDKAIYRFENIFEQCVARI
jgi:2,3,4,5-tetrahydropyridine-2-carboxylate N-succinyltransferase